MPIRLFILLFAFTLTACGGGGGGGGGTTNSNSQSNNNTSNPSLSQQSYSASDAATNDKFGVSIAISGDTMVVGAEWQDITDSNNVVQTDAGAAYVFIRNNGSWTQQAKLIADNAIKDDNFGHSVAIDGDTIVVGAPYQDDALFNSGAAYVFTRSGTTWTQQPMLKATIPVYAGQFGNSVSISGDSVAVGANSPSVAGEAYVFTRSGVTWSQQALLEASNPGAGDQFGKSVAIDGDTLVVGAPYQDGTGLNNDGAAYVFTRTGTTWGVPQILKAGNAADADNFGDTVAISGSSIAVGATGRDTGAGAAYVFTGSGASWTQQAFLQASYAEANDAFGHSIALAGDSLVVGADTEAGDANSTASTSNNNAPASGAAYVFLRSGTTWNQQHYVKATDAAANDYFGSSVGVAGDTLVVGARAKSITGVPNAGVAYVFQ